MLDRFETRRSFLKSVGAFVAASSVPSTLLTTGVAASLLMPALSIILADDAEAGTIPAPLRVKNIHTGEARELHLFAAGRWNRDALIVGNYLLRDWRENEVKTCNPKIFAALYVFQRMFAPGGHINAHSGYRSPETNRKVKGASNSYHLKAQACDFSIDGIAPSTISSKAYALRTGGVGNYRWGTHIDFGPYGPNRFWDDTAQD